MKTVIDNDSLGLRFVTRFFRMLILFGAVALGVFIISCGITTTSIVSIQDEDIGIPRFQSVAVSLPCDDLEVRSRIEGLFARQMTSPGVVVFRAMDILPPLREYTLDQIAERLREKNVQALLVVAVTDFWSTSLTTPDMTISKSKSNTTVRSAWNSLLVVKTNSTTETTTIPGITLSQSNVKLDVRMYVLDIQKSPQMIWRANSTTSGNYFARDSKILRDAATKISTQLMINGMLAVCPADTAHLAVGSGVVVLGGPNHNVMLGRVDPGARYDGCQSIFVAWCEYGDEAPQSVWDRHGPYASDTSDCSVCNMEASNPPIIVAENGTKLGRMSLNPKFEIGYREQKISEWLMHTICGQK
ncbi:MAG: hypothetical protein J7J98_03440 [candidate division Zixibacteria bacterium]|nr:hypothetical protein [candidate division Zixibacteria bacterium]